MNLNWKGLLSVAVTVLLISTACSDNSVSPEVELLFGTYEVVRVDERTTPFIISSTDTSATVFVGAG